LSSQIEKICRAVLIFCERHKTTFQKTPLYCQPSKMDYCVPDCGLFEPSWHRDKQTWWEQCGFVHLDEYLADEEDDAGVSRPPNVTPLPPLSGEMAGGVTGGDTFRWRSAGRGLPGRVA
jgi:hypothetical protein